jgi:hypothetical protein
MCLNLLILFLLGHRIPFNFKLFLDLDHLADREAPTILHQILGVDLGVCHDLLDQVRDLDTFDGAREQICRQNVEKATRDLHLDLH